MTIYELEAELRRLVVAYADDVLPGARVDVHNVHLEVRGEGVGLSYDSDPAPDRPALVVELGAHPAGKR